MLKTGSPRPDALLLAPQQRVCRLDQVARLVLIDDRVVEPRRLQNGDHARRERVAPGGQARELIFQRGVGFNCYADVPGRRVMGSTRD